ncbi:hypothetical protein AB3662_04045 [Sorangium cellulosum]|uniref:hypothetical protein n=1 Tax=Sorangium cellulosum TaxID=56 RepID=UPI003D9A4665
MSNQLIANGRYRIQTAFRRENVGEQAAEAPLSLLPEEGDNYTWEVAFNGTDSYTLRNVKTGSYLGDDDAPQTIPVPLLKGASRPFLWKIERGVEPETFTLSPKNSNGTMRLAFSIARIFPPPVAWMPASGDVFPDQLWRLVKV